MILALFIAKFAFVLVCFSYASISDIRTLRVSNRLWVLMIPLGIVFLLAEILVFGLVLNYILNIAVFVCLSVLVFHLNLMGGADAKGIITLSVFFPYDFFGVPFVMVLILLAGVLLMIWYGLKPQKVPFMPAMTAALPLTSLIFVWCAFLYS